MTKIKNNFMYIVLAVLLVTTIAVFYGCTKGEQQEPYTITGHGTVSENLDEDGNVISYTATADDWNTFSGWYDGLIKYSSQKTIYLTKDTPKGLVAKFQTDGMTGIDRLLSGAYYRYSDALDGEGEYLNFSCDAQITTLSTLSSSTLAFTSGGYASREGNGFNAYMQVKEGGEQTFATYYTDNTQDATLYIDFGTHKVAVSDFDTLGERPFSMDISQVVWKLANLASGDILSTLDGYLGVRNSVGFVAEVENSQNQTTLILDVDALLNEVKDKVSSLSDPQWSQFKDVIETLTNQYAGVGNKLPDIQLSIVGNYDKTAGEERLASLELTAIFTQSYSFEIEGTLITIPQGLVKVKLENAQISISDTPNEIPQEILATFPDAVHAVNFHAEGTLSFLKENVATLDKRVIDQYLVELDTDINLHCIDGAIDDEGNIDITKIDWEKFGFLSFKISLIQNPDDANQLARHNGSTEYLNILIDTQKFGGKVFVNADLYNPKTLGGLATSTYILNGSYDIAELVRTLPEVAKDLKEEYEEPATASLVLTTATSPLDGEKSPEEVLHEILLNFLKKLDPNNEIVTEGLEYTEFGTTLAVQEVKDLIAEKFADANSTLSSLGLHNNLFGSDTSHIAFKGGSCKYGATTKNADGEYVDADGNEFVEEYNQKHITLIEVADGEGMFDETFTLGGIAKEVDALVGKYVTVTKGRFSDGSESITFANCAGNQAEIAMRVYSAKYQMTGENTAKVTVYLTFSAGTLQSLMTGTFNVPYGLVEYSFDVQL